MNHTFYGDDIDFTFEDRIYCSNNANGDSGKIRKTRKSINYFMLLTNNYFSLGEVKSSNCCLDSHLGLLALNLLDIPGNRSLAFTSPNPTSFMTPL